MNILVIIPARGGSKGIPGKNIKLLGGKPLIGYTIDAARSVVDDTHICVTTDDDKIIEIAPLIIKKIPYVTYILDNDTYNRLPEEDKNMNKIKAILHNKVLTTLIKKDNYSYDAIVIDQFVYPKKFYEHISKAPEKITNVTFMTKAEDQVLSVAAASIICRYVFLKAMKKMSEELGTKVLLGANSGVDALAKKILEEKGPEYLKHYVKWNFKNTEKITAL